MKIIAFLLLLTFGSYAFAAENNPDITPAYGLSKRVLGDKSKGIDFELVPSDSLDLFTIESRGKQIVIGGNNVNSMACGLNHYLRYNCGIEIGWLSCEKYTLPAKWPEVESKITVRGRVKDRFFLNYCTYGYTMPWWDWAEWEHFIDWMALNGINLTLAITGQESVWYDVWKEFGLSDEQIRSYFTGPAHLPWHRMTNIDHWGGPLPQSWLDSQEALQKMIVERERSLGIRTALPAFSGHVPEQLCEIFPDAPIAHIRPWAGYTEKEAPWFLDPTSELYARIQKKFIEKQTEKYGSDHIYGLDIFNEIKPPSWEAEYLHRVGRQIYETLQAADPEAVWLQMGWLFSWNSKKWTPEKVKAYLSGAPADRQLILDYHADGVEVWRTTESFFGVPFLWCYLSNFGGNTHIAPRFTRALNRLDATYAETRINGVGCTLEGFDCDPYTHECILEKAWDIPVQKNQDDWFRHLAGLRGGCKDEYLEQAWLLVKNHLVSESRHNSTIGHSGRYDGGIEGRPNPEKKQTYKTVDKETAVLGAVVQLMLNSKGKGDIFEYDLVNFTRQWMTSRFWQMHRSYYAAKEEGNAEEMDRQAARMLELMDDMDKLLGCRTEFLLGKWIADARKMGTTTQEKDYFEQNARNILTSWSMENNYPHLNDYACRQWNGLIKGLYIPRWKAYFEAEKAGGFDQKKFWNEVLTPMEAAFWKSGREKYPSAPSGNARQLCEKILKKYRQMNGLVNIVNWPEKYPDKPTVKFSITAEKSQLKVHFEVEEDETFARATHNFDDVWKDSCCELFIMFDGEDKYYNLETSCNGYQLFAYRPDRHQREYASEDILQKIICNTSIKKHSTFEARHIDKWTLDIEIPAEAFWHSGIEDFRTVRAKGNIYKCNQGAKRKHFLSWSPIDSAKPDFHRPEFFRELSF